MGYKLTLEVPVFFVTFSFMLAVSVNSNLLIYRSCYIILHFNKSECALLGFVNNNETQHLEELVEPTATYISLVKTIVESTLGSFLCLFIAPWSDRFGRKPILLLGFLGSCLSMSLHIVFAAVESLTPWFILVLTIPVILSGGGASFMTIMSAYLTDTTTKEERAFRLGMFDVTMSLAVLLGSSSSSYILIATSYVTVYCIATACSATALIYTILFIPESLRERETENPIAGFFSISNFIEMIKTPFKRRENSKRTILLFIMISILLGFMAGGSMNIFFYFVREKLHWTLTKFTWYSTATMILEIIAATFIIYVLHTKLKIKESILIFVGTVFSVAGAIVHGFAVKDWQIYMGAILNLPSAGQSALMRSLISKLVHQEEVAKVLSAFSIGSNILDPISKTGFTELYNATIKTNPGLYNFVTAAISFCASVIFMAVLIVQHDAGTEDYDVLENDQNGDVVSEPENLIANAVDQETVVAK